MRSRRILAISAALAISTLGVGLASAEDNDRYDRQGRYDRHDRYDRYDRGDHHRKWDRHHRRFDNRHRYVRPPRGHVRRPYYFNRGYRPIRRLDRPYYNYGYTLSAAEQILYQYDMNGDGYIGWWEARHNSNLQRHFNHIDHDHDGFLTLREIEEHYDH